MSDVLVVHLVWHPLGPDPFRRFMDSYRRFDAGIAHRLLLVFKEFPEGYSRQAHEAAMGNTPCEQLEMAGTVLDIPAYFRIAALRNERYVCFLNSQSEIASPQWLAKLHAHASDPTVGVAGVTGSWESHLTDAVRGMSFQAQQLGLAVTDELLRANIPAPYYNFQLFPNPHIRTNGFMVARERFLSLPFVPANDKLQCYLFESGQQGMSMHLLGQKLRAVVVGRDGQAYDPLQWPGCRAFRSGEQENLLITDAHTRAYVAADAGERSRLRSNAWGAS